MITDITQTGIQDLLTVNEGMSTERQEMLFSAIAQSITGNLTVRVVIQNLLGRVGFTDGNRIYVGDDESILRIYQRHDGKAVNPFLMRLKLVVHETLHALFTPYKQYQQEMISMVLRGYDAHQVQYIFDIVEDLVVESREPTIFGGWVHSACMYGSYTSFLCAPKLDGLSPEQQWAAALCHVRDTCNFESGMRFKGKFTSFKAKEVWVKIKPMIEKILQFTYTTSEKGALLREIAVVILEAFPQSDRLSDEDLARKPLESRLAELPRLPNDIALPNKDGKTRETQDTDQTMDSTENHSSSDEKNTQKQNSEQNKQKNQQTESSEQQSSDNQSNDLSDDGDYSDDNGFTETEERQNESDWKISKLLQQINQYACSVERMEQNSSISDKLLERDFNGAFLHNEKHTGSLTVLPSDREFYHSSVNANKRLIRSLNALFKKELKRIRDENEFYTSGRVDPVRIATHKQRSVELFRRPMGDSGQNEAAITLRIDQSGSMNNRFSNRGRKLCSEAGELACVLTEVFTDLRISLQVAGFAEVGVSEEHEIFKEFDSCNTPKEAVAKSRLNKSSSTPTGWTIYQGVHELKMRPEKNKVFILITDGYPSSKVKKEFVNTNQIRKYIRDAERSGIAFLCLLVGECEPGFHHKLFGDSLIVANRSTSLAVAISPKLKRVAKHWNN